MSLNDAYVSTMTMGGLNLIQQALSIYDSDLKLVICNRPFREMFDLTDEHTTPGSDFSTTIRYLAERGEYGEVTDLDELVRQRVEQARAFVPHYMERTRPDGRTISVEGSPLPTGGWVTVYTDISRVKTQEALLRARSAELSDKVFAYAEEISAKNRELGATITALEEMKRQLTEMEARTRLTTEMMPAHIAHVNRRGLYTFSNRRLGSVMPGRPANIVGQPIETVLGEQIHGAIKPHLSQALSGSASVVEFTAEDSGRRIRTALTPDRAPSGQIQGVYILSMDVTEETQNRSALQQTRRREMAAQLTSGLAHDFSNLLTIILGSQSRLRRMELPPEAADFVAATLSAAQRGGALLSRIADITGNREWQAVPSDLGAVLRDLETLAFPALPPEISLTIQNTTNLRHVLLDTGLVQDALLNLILNARDAIGSQGEIRLSVETLQDTWLEFTVQDTGPGFSETALQHALEPFFTTKGGEGSGLGLAMVYDTAKLAGGRVRVGNAPQGGARVSLRLPLRPTEASLEPGLILLVEDSADLRASIRDMLISAGHAVIESTSVPEALSLLAEVPEITGILSDILLEGDQTGIDLARAVQGSGTPLCLMTSLPHFHPHHTAAKALAPVLHKPFTAAELIARLTRTDSAP